MYKSQDNRKTWLTTVTMLAFTALVYAGEKTGQLTSTRMTLHHLLSPGRLMVLSLGTDSQKAAHQTITVQSSDGTEIAELQNALLQNELQRRRLLIENARLHNELQTSQQLAPLESVTRRNRVEFQAMPARILSHSGMPDSLREAFIDIGQQHGLQHSQLVVEGSGLLLDKGTADGLDVGSKVTHGTSVIGRIAKVSKWVGLVQPVTHPDFSAAVQIVKLAPQGAAYGATGLLEGLDSSQCRIVGIPYTAAVTVGDEVFSSNINGVNGPRLYYGRIVQAEFSAGGTWDIRVQPAFDPQRLNNVAVVQPQVQVPSAATESQVARRPRFTGAEY